MNARRRLSLPRSTGSAEVLDLTRAFIERALRARSRYRYVRPRIEREGLGWSIVSPNCSRKVHPDGADIRIAWLCPDPVSGWQLHRHNDGQQRWELCQRQQPLHALLRHLCADPQREFWR